MARVDRPRLLVISHPAVLEVNQLPYVSLMDLGWDVRLLVPARWRHDYADRPLPPQRHPRLRDGIATKRVFLGGRPQRHGYLTSPTAVLRQASPDVVFVEAEAFSVSALQWSTACNRQNIPFGVQAAENLDRRLPFPVRAWRRRVLSESAFVAARSASAASLAHRWGARGGIEVVPHAVPPWAKPEAPPHHGFVVGYAGRLVREKGLFDLLSAVEDLVRPAEVLLVGDGAERAALEARQLRNGSKVRVFCDVRHDDMAGAYAQMDVLVLPSRTTPTWTEQFGRVLVEALWCGVPVIGSNSGEIPWVIETTGGGIVFPEGDTQALADAIDRIRVDRHFGERLARQGRAEVERQFTVQASAEALDRLLRPVLGH